MQGTTKHFEEDLRNSSAICIGKGGHTLFSHDTTSTKTQKRIILLWKQMLSI